MRHATGVFEIRGRVALPYPIRYLDVSVVLAPAARATESADRGSEEPFPTDLDEAVRKL